MKQPNELAAFLDYVDQVIDVHEVGPVVERYVDARAVVLEYLDYLGYFGETGLSPSLESVTATAGGSPAQGSGPFRLH